MKTRWLVVVAVVLMVLGLSVGLAQGRTGPGRPVGAGWMDAMHDSPAMQRFLDQLPADVRAQCEEMHELMDGAGMMGGSGMMGR